MLQGAAGFNLREASRRLKSAAPWVFLTEPNPPLSIARHARYPRDHVATVLFATDFSRWYPVHNFCFWSRLQPSFSKSSKARLKPAGNPGPRPPNHQLKLVANGKFGSSVGRLIRTVLPLAGKPPVVRQQTYLGSVSKRELFQGAAGFNLREASRRLKSAAPWVFSDGA